MPGAGPKASCLPGHGIGRVVSENLFRLATVYQTEGDLLEAESLHRCALQIKELILGRDHPDVAACLHNLAIFYHSEQRWADAEASYRRAMAILERCFSPSHPRMLRLVQHYTVLLWQLNKKAKAAALEAKLK